MKVSIETIAGFSTVGIKLVTKPMSDEIPAHWQSQGVRLGEVPDAKPLGAFGVMELMPDGDLHYMIALASDAKGDLPAGMKRWDVPAGKYAMFETGLASLRDDYREFYGTWLPQADVTRRDGPEYESYGPEFNPADPASVIRVFVPVG